MDKNCSNCDAKINIKGTRLKNNLFKIIIVIILFIIFLLLFLNGKEERNYVALINKNWNITLPYCDEKVYYVDDESNSPLGDGDRYTILKYTDKEKIEALNLKQWDKTLTAENIDIANLIMSKYNVPNNKRIDFNQDLLYMVIAKGDFSSRIIIVYDKNVHQLYVFEHIL